MRNGKGLKHDRYVKGLLRRILGNHFLTSGAEVRVPYQGVTARIDGVVQGCCAVEIESSVDKEIRGSLMDLFFHPYKKKLLVLVYGSMNNPERTVRHCQGILEALGKKQIEYSVVLLEGDGDLPREVEDIRLLRTALAELDCL